ncbi:MAG: acyl carrier protein [Corynebacterium humireducens]|jgi:acyl carrier protein|uniref:Acyl carrier protein n=1 Tax=Corynebacterium humireducens TaxID=1223514 RepID=A0A7X6PMQ9_9CORY|nr:acyl carrier protein [Corynebacterium humireducens]
MTISPELAQIIEEASGLEADALTPEAKISELGINSLAMIEIAVRIEDAFGIRLDDETVFRTSTVGELAELIESPDPR